jgi:hypothetical protein
MPRYEYRLLNPMRAVERAMLDWITGPDKDRVWLTIPQATEWQRIAD